MLFSIECMNDTARQLYGKRLDAESALEEVYGQLAESRRETGRLPRQYNVARRHRDAVRGKWLDLSETMDSRERFTLEDQVQADRLRRKEACRG